MKIRVLVAALMSMGYGLGMAQTSESASSTSTSTPGYTDNYLFATEATEQEVDSRVKKLKSYTGPYQYYFMEISRNHTKNGSGQGSTLLGMDFEVPNYGIWSVRLQGQELGRGVQTQTKWKIEGFDIPLQDKWSAYVGAGHLTPRQNPMMEQGSRFYLPTYNMLGVTAKLSHAQEGQLSAFVGTPGSNSVALTDETRPQGSMMGFGIEKKVFDGKATASMQGMIMETPESGPTGRKEETQSLTGGLRVQRGDMTLQGNTLVSSSLRGNGAALWVDGTYKSGLTSYRGGAFTFTENAYWGYNLLGSKSTGLYGSLDYSTRRLSYGASGEMVHINGGDYLYGSGYGRYQLDSKWGLGGGLQLRKDPSGVSYAGYGSVDYRMDSGPVQLRMDKYKDANSTGVLFALDKSFDTIYGSIGANIGLGRSWDRATEKSFPTTSAGLTYSLQIHDNISLTSNVRYIEQQQNNTLIKGTNTLMGATVQLGNGFSLNGSVNWFDTKNVIQIPVSSPISSVVLNPKITQQNSRSIWVTLRWEDSKGSRGPSGGTGRVQGLIYMDVNNNMRYDAGEPVAANVTVLLDNHYMGITNTLGEFNFYSVVPGQHQLTVLADKIPLPWVLDDDGPRTIYVQLRQTTNVPIGLKKY